MSIRAERTAGFLLALLLLLGLAASPSRAPAQTVTVSIKVEVLVPLFRSAWGAAGTAKIEQGAAERLITYLKQQQHLQFWKFAPDDPATHGIWLMLRVTEEPQNQVNFVVEAWDRGDGSQRLWSTIWMPPGDLSVIGAPPLDQALDKLDKDLRGRLDNDRTGPDALRAWATDVVPIASSGAQLGSASAGGRRIIVPYLPWHEFSNLQISEFHLVSRRTADKALVKVIARGAGMSAPYAPAGGGSPFDAVALLPISEMPPEGIVRQFDEAAQDIDGLQLGPLFLDHYIPPDDFVRGPTQ